ncbi:MAG: BMP family ABC transporter substrate-binding protein [Candidatus Cloacimonetes bacterium 4572_65]|nr:MAG: BMP family ABC transporter substrate-binding protein [Candidatus Cloacimonetes bacterium 4572_65]
MKKILLLLMIVTMLISVIGCAKKEAVDTDKLKVGFVYVGPVGDAGWTYAHNQGRIEVEKMDIVEKTIFAESVQENAESERTIRQMAEKDCDLIFTTSFGFMDYTINSAKDYPEKTFMHCSGYKTSENVSAYFGKMYQARYLAGIVAGKMTENNLIGYVAPFPIPECVRLANAFYLGVKSVNPDAKMKMVFVNSWYDPSKEKEYASSLIDAGCDLIAQHADSAAPQQAAEERGVWCIGYNTDMRDFAPTRNLTSTVWNWSVFYKDVVTKVHNKTWTSGNYWPGIETGIVGLAPYNDAVTEDIRTLVDVKKQELIDGTLDIFAGPLYDNSGNLKVEEGATISSEDLTKIDWYVDGIETEKSTK